MRNVIWPVLVFSFGWSVPLGLDSYIPAPDHNPLTEENVRLGRLLFRDPILSRDQKISCATCHIAANEFTDSNPVAVGIEGRKGDRRTPSIVNRAYGKRFFWDGRANSLEEQVLMPITNPKEMDLSIDEAVNRLNSQSRSVSWTKSAIANALASYVRTILAGNSPYDRYVAGDKSAVSEQAQLGLRLFRGKAGCLTCHVGANLTDEKLHNTGAGKSEAEGSFKTPTLRQVANRAPYMHDGSVKTLEEVVDFYNDGGKRNPKLDPDVRPLHLTDMEKSAIIAFLRSLTGEVREGGFNAGTP